MAVAIVGKITELARKASMGDEAAFEELYRLTRDRAYFVAYSITHNEEDSLDILQESYLKAWKKLREMIEPEICAAWMNQIVGNTAKDFVKKRRPQLFEPLGEEDNLLMLQPEEDSAYIPDAAMDTTETKRLIMEIIDDLPEDQRLCVLLYYYDDLPVADIAKALEVPISTVSNRLAYARKKIARSVEELEKSGKVKLRGAAPLSLLPWLLRGAASESGKILPPIILGGESTGTANAILMGAALPKIMAGIAAVIIIAGSVVTAALLLPKRLESAPDITKPVAEPTAVAPDAIAALDAVLSSTLDRWVNTYTEPHRAIPEAGVTQQAITQAISTRETAEEGTTSMARSTTITHNAASSTITAAKPAATTTAAAATTAAKPVATTTAAATTATTATTTTAPRLITKSSNGVIIEYMSGTLPEDVVFLAVVGSAGFTTRMINPSAGLVVERFTLSCTVNGTQVPVQGSVTVRLPVPAHALPDIALLEVQHVTAPLQVDDMPVQAEGGYLVFTTTYI